MHAVTDWIPWLLLGLALIALVDAVRAARWARRTLSGRSAGRAPGGLVSRFLGLQGMAEVARRRAEHLEAERAEQDRRVAELLARLTQAVLVIDAQDRLRLANPAALQLFRIEPSAEGRSFATLARSAELLEFLRRIRSEGGAETTLQFHRAPAPDIWVRVSAAPTGTGGDASGAVVVVAEDVTQLRRLQSVEREFLANVSHDLRTPVTILRGYAETLATDFQTLGDPERERFVAKIASAAARLGSLLEGMLSLATLESGAAPRPEPGAIARAAEEAVDSLQERARSQGLELTLEIADREGCADALQARRVALNLVENVLAHARGATRAEVRVAGGMLSVADDGAGVAPAELTRIFDRLYRTDRSRRQGGAGLGLSIVRQIAEAHGGQARAEANRPRGLRIEVTFGPG